VDVGLRIENKTEGEGKMKWSRWSKDQYDFESNSDRLDLAKSLFAEGMFSVKPITGQDKRRFDVYASKVCRLADRSIQNFFFLGFDDRGRQIQGEYDFITKKGTFRYRVSRSE